jgi:hypothetical protein
LQAVKRPYLSARETPHRLTVPDTENTMTKKILMGAVLGVLVAGTGCHRNLQERTEDKAENAAEKTRDAAHNAKEKGKDAVEKAGDKIEDATDK